MKTAAKEILQALNTQTEPRYASWLINRNWKRLGLYNVDELVAEFLAPMEKAGLIAPTLGKSRVLYEITSAGRLALLEAERAPLQVVPPRERPFMEWDGRMQWDAASERGCHPNIGRVGVMC